MAKNSCYRITAKGPKRATVVIDGIIGDYGNESINFRNDVADLGEIDDLLIKITSRGGDVVEGMGMAEVIATHPAKTHASIEGVAASMGSVIAMAADKVSMTKNSLFFVHNAGGIAFGDANEMRRAATALDAMTDALTGYYKDRDLNLSDDELKAAMDSETYYNAEQALEAGFIDEISSKSTDMKAAASLGWDKAAMENMPKEFLTQITNLIEPETTDGSAVEKPKGKTMTDEKTYSEAELQAAVNKAVEDAKTDTTPDSAAAQALASMLADENATIERVRAAAEMGLDSDQAKAFMAHMASASTDAPKAEVVDTAKPANTTAELMKQVMAMAGRDMDDVNTNAGTDSDEEVAAPKTVDPKAELERLTNKNRELV